MLRTIHLHGALRRRFKLSKVQLDADSVAEAVRGLAFQLPGFAQYIREKQYLITAANDSDELVIDEGALLLNLGQRRDIHITPAAQAAGIETILIVGFAALAAVSIAASFLLKPKAPDANARERNDRSFIFGGGVNSTEQGHVIPLIYGERMRVGSIVVSGGITTTDVAASAIQAGSGGGYVGSSQGVLGGSGGEGGRSWEVARSIEASKGGKGGGGGGRVAEESPNSLRSQATVKIVDLVGEGEIGGLVDGLKSVFLDGTPVQNQDGSYNFSGYSLEERVGLPDQDPMPGFTQQENGVEVGVDVTALNPVVRTIADPVVDVVRVTLSVNSLFEQDTKNGDLKPTSVQIAIDHQSNGGGFTTVVNDVIQGKTNSPYQRSYDVRLSGEGPHDIRVRRITPDSELASLKNETRWDSYFEITEAKLIYPDSALYGVTVDAKQFGSNIPVRTYEVRGLVIDVPTNYDVETRTYTGIWDGTFKRAVCGNPAWVLYDIIKNDRYGLGKRIPLSSIDKYGLYAVAQYSDGLVPNGEGGFQPRYTINACINSAESAYNVLASIASAFRGFVHWGSGSVMVTQDRPEDPTMLVTPANVVNGKLSYRSVVDKHRLRSVAIVYWNDPDDEYRLVPEIVEDDELIRQIGWQPRESVVRFGCTNRIEAHFFAKWMLDDQKYANKAVLYDAADDHNFVAPGAIVSVADPKFTEGRRGGRVRQATANGVTLDAPVDLSAGEVYHLRVVLPDGTVSRRRVTTPTGSASVLTLTGASWSNPPMTGSVWALESDTVANRQFRVRSATADEPPYSIYAVVHDPNSYQRVEQGVDAPPSNFLDLPTGPLAVPNDIKAYEFLLNDGTASVPAVQFSWSNEQDPRILFYQARYKRPGGDWQDLEDGSLMSRVVRNTEPGNWGFMVRAVDGLGRKTAWAKGEVLLQGQRDTLPNVNGLYLTRNDIALQTFLNWSAPEDPRPLRYEVFFGETATFASATSLGVVDATEFVVTKVGHYWVRTVFLEAASPAPPRIQVTSSDLPKPGWDEVRDKPAPGEILNSRIEQTASGRLQYRPLPDAPPVSLGQITLPGIGAVAEAAMRRAEDDIDQLALALATALDEASNTRATFRDAGFYADALTGQIRIHAVEQTKERLSTAEITLNSALAQIRLRATTTYVNEQIALAVIDPSQVAELSDIFFRLGEAEVAVDGLNATVTTLATVAELGFVEGRVTNAEEAIDALEGTITSKVDTTTFNLLATRVTNAETVLTALGDSASIISAVSAVRSIDKSLLDNEEADLLGLLLADETRRDQVTAVAAARQELTARLIEGDAAEAASRLGLQVRVGAAEASLASESLARASGDAALVFQITELAADLTTTAGTLQANIDDVDQARIDGDEALASSISTLTANLDTELENLASAVEDEAQARVEADGVIAAGLSQQVTAGRTLNGQALELADLLLESLLKNDENRRQVNGAIAGARQEITAQIVSEVEALSTRILALVARAAGNEASIVNESLARASADRSIATTISNLNVTFSNALSGAVSSLGASITDEALARADADGVLAGEIGTLTTTVNENSATLVTFGESINGLLTRWGAKVDVNGRVGGLVLNGTGEEIDLTIVSDTLSVVDPDTGEVYLDADEDGLRLQNGKVIMNNGTNMLVMGAGFGVDNQFVMWFGPSRAINLCNEDDALFFLDVTGDGEYGLRLGSNFYRNSGTATSTASDAEVTVGPFTTDGGPKQVSIGFQYRRTVQISDAFAYTGTPQAVLRVERRLGTGDFTTVGEFTFNGQATGEDGFGPSEPGFAQIVINQNASFTDPTGGTNDFTYRARIITRSVGGLTSNVILEDTLTQRIPLIIVEQIT